MPGKVTIAATILGLAVAQVILPSVLDLIVTLAIAGAAAWGGFKAGKGAA